MNTEITEKVKNVPTSLLNDITIPEQVPFQQSDNIVDPGEVLDDSKAHIKAENTGLFNSDKIAPNQPSTPITPQSAVKLGDSIGGKRAVEVMDAIIPSLVVLVISAIGYSVGKKELQLDADEKKTIAPVLQDYLNSININMNNPLHNLLLVAGIIYGAKIIDVIPNAEKKRAKVLPMKNQNLVPSENKQPAADPDINYANFKNEVEQTISEASGKRKKSRKDTIEWLNNNGTMLRLKKKYGIK